MSRNEAKWKLHDHQTETVAKADRRTIVFMIMPFRETQTRRSDDLDAFFNRIKQSVESAKLQNVYQVTRSDDQFNITKNIMLELYTADLVICDLSGAHPNPNVMYELGIRLALSDKPVILIQERPLTTERVFDIAGFYIYVYDPHDDGILMQYLLDKLSRIESGEEIFRSPVRDVLITAGTEIAARGTAPFHAITNLNIGLQLAMRAYNANVTEFVSKMNSYLCPPKSAEGVETVGWWINNVDRLRELDWSLYHKWPLLNPMIETFWQCSELRDSLPSAVFFNLYGFMANYHQYYFANAAGWDLDPAFLTAEYFANTGTVRAAIEPIKLMLTPEGRRHLSKLSQLALEYLQASSLSR
jgi:hypothetical protein